VVLDIQVNNIIGGTRYTGCLLQKKNTVVRRQAFVQFESTNKYECTYENYSFLNDTVSTTEYAETMWQEAMFAEFKVLRIT